MSAANTMFNFLKNVGVMQVNAGVVNVQGGASAGKELASEAGKVASATGPGSLLATGSFVGSGLGMPFWFKWLDDRFKGGANNLNWDSKKQDWVNKQGETLTNLGQVMGQGAAMKKAIADQQRKQTQVQPGGAGWDAIVLLMVFECRRACSEVKKKRTESFYVLENSRKWWKGYIGCIAFAAPVWQRVLGANRDPAGSPLKSSAGCRFGSSVRGWVQRRGVAWRARSEVHSSNHCVIF
jgi:hypothetical protein